MKREDFTFPTRQFPYRAGGPEGVEAGHPELAPNKLYRFVLGIDPVPAPIDPHRFAVELCDPFAELLLVKGIFPLTARSLLRELDRYNHEGTGIGNQASFLVADGGQVPWSKATKDLNRQFRVAVSREGAGDRFLLVSTSTVLDSETQFLQVLSWDEKNKVYNYYERRSGVWFWAGNSEHALDAPTRGRGPFDSHVNGSLVMKELRAPWIHWHSMDASILADAFETGDPFLSEPLFVNRKGAQEFETLVRSKITLWNDARIGEPASDVDSKAINALMRQVLTTTTVNLVTSHRVSRLVKPSEMLTLPITFFLDTDSLFDAIGLSPTISLIQVKGRLYLDSLEKYNFHIADDSSGFREKGDVFFGFLVPERAYEDTNVLDLMIRKKLIGRKFAASLLMVDFPNPVWSPRRSKLMDHFYPITQPGGLILPADLEHRFVESVSSAADPGTPEIEFMNNLINPDAVWEKAFSTRIEDYFMKLDKVSETAHGFDEWVRLAESRRREFRRKPLAEFSLTMPRTNISEDAPPLEMTLTGNVRTKV